MIDDLKLSPLFYRCRPKNRREIADFGRGKDFIVVRKGTVLDLNTVYNSFFESYWRGVAPLESLQAHVRLHGTGVARLFRRSPLRSEEMIAESGFDGAQTVCLAATMSGVSSLEFGRLFIEIEATDREVQVYEGEWGTMDEPVRDVRLAVAFCTFNKEDMLARNLKKMKAVSECNELEAIIVVDQGTRSFRASRGWAEVAGIAKLRVITQDNFGGAGGFTRGMIESLHLGCSHTVLMDDDIQLDQDIIPRLIAFLKYQRHPVVIGGAMFDLFKPLRLFAADETLDLENLVHVNRLHNTNLAGLNALDVFLQPGRGTYNGWWFCCFPNQMLEKHGLPLPVFIRGDDTEFGERLSRYGESIVTSPSIFVWHEPFYAKSSAWMQYYERRNFMVTATLHGRLSQAKLLKLVFRTFVFALAKSNYEFAMAILKSFEDFLRGPAFVFGDPRAAHVRLLEDLAVMRGKVVQGARPYLRRRIDETITTPIVAIRMIFFQLLRAPVTADQSSAAGDVFHIDDADLTMLSKRTRPFGLYDPHSDQVTYYQANRRTARILVWRFFLSACKLMTQGSRLRVQYRSQQAIVTSGRFWSEYLELNK